MAFAGSGDISTGTSVSTTPRSLTALNTCPSQVSRSSSHFCISFSPYTQAFFNSSRQMCCPASWLPWLTVVIKVSWTLFLCSIILFACVWTKEGEQDQLKTHRVRGLFSPILKGMQVNVNGVQSTWSIGKIWSSTSSRLQKEQCKD